MVAAVGLEPTTYGL